MGHVWGKKRNPCRIVRRKLEGNRPLGRPRRRWENNIKYVSKNVIGLRGPYSPGSGQGQMVDCCPMGWTVQGSNFDRYKRFAVPRNRPHRLWEPLNLFSEYWE
jgi:hypothetical protein